MVIQQQNLKRKTCNKSFYYFYLITISFKLIFVAHSAGDFHKSVSDFFKIRRVIVTVVRLFKRSVTSCETSTCTALFSVLGTLPGNRIVVTTAHVKEVFFEH